MKTSCIEHPSKERMLVIRQWQIIACDGNRCAAALLSFFEYSHNWKAEQAEKARELNRYAQQSGMDARHDESLVQWHNNEQLEDGILHQYEKKTITRALALLEEKGFVQRVPHIYIRANGLPDRTRHFLFKPETINDWLRFQYPKLDNGIIAKVQNRTLRGVKMDNTSSNLGPQTIDNNHSKHLLENNSVCEEKKLSIEIVPAASKTNSLKVGDFSAIEEIYGVYPRKVNRRAAEVAIEKALKRIAKGEDKPEGFDGEWPPLSPVDWLRERVLLFARSPKGQPPQGDKDYRPYPATWMNNAAYCDDSQEWYRGNDNANKSFTEAVADRWASFSNNEPVSDATNGNAGASGLQSVGAYVPALPNAQETRRVGNFHEGELVGGGLGASQRSGSLSRISLPCGAGDPD